MYIQHQLLFLKRLCDNREKEQKLRVVFINNIEPKSYTGEQPLKYAGNEIKTSKVIQINFLSK